MITDKQPKRLAMASMAFHNRYQITGYLKLRNI